jgi:hypothetical protein
MSPRPSPPRRGKPKPVGRAAKPTCFGRTLSGARCKEARPALWPVCRKHRLQPWSLAFILVFTVLASLPDLETLTERAKVWAGGTPPGSIASNSTQPSPPPPPYPTRAETERIVKETLAIVSGRTPLNQAGADQKERELEQIKQSLQDLARKVNEQASPGRDPKSDERVAELQAELEAEKEKNRRAAEQLREGGHEAILASLRILEAGSLATGVVVEGTVREVYGPEKRSEFLERVETTVREGRGRYVMAGTWMSGECAGPITSNCRLLEAESTTTEGGMARFEWRLAPPLEQRVAARLKSFVRESALRQGSAALSACALYESAGSPIRAVLAFAEAGLSTGPEASRLMFARR